MTIEIKVSTPAEIDADDAATLRDAADVLRRHQWRNEAEVQEIEEFADLLDPIIDAEILGYEEAIWDEAIAAAAKYLEDAVEYQWNGTPRKPSNFKRAGRYVSNGIPNPYRKAES
jgi:hypothetical protein